MAQPGRRDGPPAETAVGARPWSRGRACRPAGSSLEPADRAAGVREWPRVLRTGALALGAVGGPALAAWALHVGRIHRPRGGGRHPGLGCSRPSRSCARRCCCARRRGTRSCAPRSRAPAPAPRAARGDDDRVLMSATLPPAWRASRALSSRRVGRMRERFPVVLGTMVSQTLLNRSRWPPSAA